jgi:hypothetical protein
MNLQTIKQFAPRNRIRKAIHPNATMGLRPKLAIVISTSANKIATELYVFNNMTQIKITISKCTSNQYG